MKLLFDENLSYRLVTALADLYPDSMHGREVGLLGADDHRIWRYAGEHDFLLVSKDTDFYERSLVYGAPPKVVWLRIGNATVQDTAILLRKRHVLVRQFFEDATASFLPLSPA